MTQQSGSSQKNKKTQSLFTSTGVQHQNQGKSLFPYSTIVRLHTENFVQFWTPCSVLYMKENNPVTKGLEEEVIRYV